MAGFKGIDAIKGAIETYATGGALDFFTLKNDGDKAEVRILHNDADDLDVILAHELQIGGKKKYVECLKTYEQPCPACEQQLKNTLKMFLALYVIRKYETEGKKEGKWSDVNKVQLWDRGRDTINRILNLVNKKGDLRKHVYEILRTGKAGDTSTSYDIDPFDDHKHMTAVPIEDLAKREDIYQFVQQMDYDAMKAVLKGGSYATPTRNDEGGDTKSKKPLPF